MKTLSLAGLASLAALGAQAQSTLVAPPQSLVVTATRSLEPVASLRDAVVITREDLESAGSLSLGEVLERRAGIQLRATGGPGQPQGLFIRGAGTAQTLVLVDGLRVSSATVGTTSIENIPLELIERIEIVKGPLSSLYGSEAIGGVVQIFTRGRSTPHLFGTAAYGTDNDRRVSVGVATSDERTLLSLAAGARKVDAPSATNARNFCHNPDRDPYENVFVNLHAAHRMWQDELLSLDAFGSRGKAAFDTCTPEGVPSLLADRNDQTLAGAKFTSSSAFTPDWTSRLSIGHGRDRIETRGAAPSRFETLQDQATWINELKVPAGTMVAGVETVRQRVRSDEAFAKDNRDTNSAFLGLNEAWAGQRLEASVRHDDDASFGKRTTGSASYGLDWGAWGMLAATYAKGFRAPTFFDLYGPTITIDGGGFPLTVYQANPNLRPEHNVSREISWRAAAASTLQWRITGFDNRIDDLITYVFPTVQNVEHARIRGVEASIDAAWLGTRWHASVTAQRPRNEDTSRRLQGRAERLASVSAERTFGRWTVGASVLAVGDRFDSTTEDAATRLPSYAVVDARIRYRFEKFWSVELAATNLANKRYESAVGYDAPRQAVLLSVRFDAT